MANSNANVSATHASMQKAKSVYGTPVINKNGNTNIARVRRRGKNGMIGRSTNDVYGGIHGNNLSAL